MKNRTLANLSRWPEDKVEALRGVLKGRRPGWPRSRALRDLPQPSPRPCRRGARDAARPRPRRAHRPGALSDARPRRRHGLRPGDRPRLQARHRPGASRTRRRAPASARCSGSRRVTTTTSMRRWTGSCPRQARIEDALAARHLEAAPSCSTTSPRPPSREGPARSVRSGIRKTACTDASRSSTGCSPPQTACPSRSRCSRATPATPRPSPPR